MTFPSPADARANPHALVRALESSILGQPALVNALVLTLVAGGHVLVGGPPGIAKTLACRCLADAVAGSFQRVQFTPDLLPSDIVGTRIFDARVGTFSTVRGPVMTNVLLADEINRAPAKVQSALLEAMQERQVTIGRETLALPDPFFVMATTNPHDGAGTYALPAAQLDRFLMNVTVAYPSDAAELAILQRYGLATVPRPHDVVTLDDVRCWRRQARTVYVDATIERYIVALVLATRVRNPYVEFGASPRATLALAALARARALLAGRRYAIHGDVRSLAAAVLEHRMVFTYRAAADGLQPADYIRDLIGRVPTP